MVQRFFWNGLFIPLLALIFTFAPAVNSSAAQWGMYLHDAQHTGKSAGIGPSSVVSPKWSTEPYRFTTSGVAVGDDGTIYAASYDGTAYAFNPDGTVKYTLNNIGVCCSPPVIGPDGTIYFSGNALYAVNPDFSVKWVYGPGGTCCGSMTIGPDGTIYVANGALHAVNPLDGSAKWVFIATDGTLVLAGPALSHNGSEVYVATAKTLYTLNVTDQSVRWQIDIGNIAGTAPLVDSAGTIYIPSNSSVLALNPDGSLFRDILIPAGKQVTAMAFDAENQGGTLICLVYGFTIIPGTNPPAAIWEANGELYAMDPYSSAVRWVQSITGGFDLSIDQAPYAKLIIDARGSVYLATGVYSGPVNEVGVHFYGFSAFGNLLFDYYALTTLPANPLPPSDTRLPAMDNSGTIYMYLDGALKAFGSPDVTPPVLGGLYNQMLEAASSQGASAYFNVTATDLVDPAPTVYCDQMSGNIFPIGTTYVNCWATDSSYNSAYAYFTVSVQDTTMPVITAPVDISIEATGPQTAVVLGTATAMDTVGVVSLTNNAPATFPVGTTYVSWTARDAAGNSGTAIQNITVRDTIPPVITGAATTAPNANGWYNSNVTAHFFASDSGSGINTLTADTTLASEGSNQSVTGIATDKADNSSSFTINGINIDKTPPTTSATMSGTLGENGIYISIVQITLMATDALSTVNTTEYRLNGGGWSTYTGPFSITAEGVTIVEFHSFDKAGNIEAIKPNTVMIDRIAPMVSSIDPVIDSISVPLNKVITITFTENIQVGINYGDITLMNGPSNVTINKSINGNVLTITLPAPALLSRNSKYRVSIPAGAVKDLAGNSLASLNSFGFTTVKK